MTRDGTSNLQYRVAAADLAPAAALAGQADVRRCRARSRAPSPAIAPSCTPPAPWPCRTPPTARRRGRSTPTARYDVTLPDLDAQRIRVEAQTRAALVEAAGQSLREVTADVRYADRAAAFSATAGDATRARSRPRHASRCRSGKPAVAWRPPQSTGVDLQPRSPDRDRRRRVVVAHRAGPHPLRRRSRRRRPPGPGERGAAHRGGGAVALGDAAARTVPVDRPLRLTLTDVDLAAVDRLARTGRGLGGMLNGTATASGELDAPVGRRAS